MAEQFLLPERYRTTLLGGFLRDAATEAFRNFLAARSGALGARVVQPPPATGAVMTGGAPPTGALSAALAAPGTATPPAPPTPAAPSSVQEFFASPMFTAAHPGIQLGARKLLLGRQRQGT